MDSLTQQLIQSADANHKDVLGWDPWCLRTLLPRKDLPLLSEILKVDLSPYYHYKFFPKIIHFIWIGDFIPNLFKENVLAWQKINPNYLIIFWHDKSYFNREEINELENWCQEHGIYYVSISKTFYGSMINESIYRNSLLKQSFGACSDLLRLNLLYFFGGVYTDFDVSCVVPLGDLHSPDGIILNAHERKLFYHLGSLESLSELVIKNEHFNMCANNLVTNDLIAARANIEDFEKVLDEIEKTCLANISDNAISYQAKKPFTKSDYLNLVVRERTIYTTGPGTLWKYFEKKYQKNIPDILKFDPSHFVFYSLSSWFNKPVEYKISVEKIEIAKTILTNLIHDLTVQPSIFSLLQYTTLITQHNLIETIMAFFISYHSHLLINVRWVWLGDNFKNCKNKFLDKNKFPKISYVDGKLEAQSFTGTNKKIFLTDVITSPIISHSFTSYLLSEIINNQTTTNYKLFASNLPKGWFIQEYYLRGDWKEIADDEFNFILTVKTESDVFAKKIKVRKFLTVDEPALAS